MSPDFKKQLSVLIFLLSKTDSDGFIAFYLNTLKEPLLSQLTSKELRDILTLFANQKLLDLTNYEKELVNVIIFKEQCLEYLLKISDEHNSELNEILIKQTEEIETQKKELEDIYGFLPENIVNEIDGSKVKLAEILSSIDNDKSKFLLPIKPKIEEISQYLEKTEKVIKNYDNIYLNIIKPIKSEGSKGINATRNWAIASIILTAILSFYFSFKAVHKESKSETQGKSIDHVQNNDYASSLERKVDFLINETLGINESFKVDTNKSTIMALDKKIILFSIKDTITVQPWIGNAYLIGNECYQAVDLAFFLNNRRITSQGLKGLFLKNSKVNIIPDRGDVIAVVEKDTLIFKNHSILIDKIFCTASKCAPIGDKFDGIRILKLK
jgi:hypothetical protein